MGGTHLSEESFNLALKLLKRQGAVQRDIAKALGIHESTISRIKKAKSYTAYIDHERARKNGGLSLPPDTAKQIQEKVEKQIAQMVEKAGKDVLALVNKKLYAFNSRILGIEGTIRILRTGHISGKPVKKDASSKEAPAA